MIHYHGTPMTPVGDMIKSFKTRHALVSYEHPAQVEIAAEICQSIVLDNGAFSAWKSGLVHDFDGYAEWAAKWVRHPAVDWCLIPDVIDGTAADNDAKIKDWPLSRDVSVPVYHMHEALSRLGRLVDEYPRVALGSSGEFARVGSDAWWGRMSEMMDVACTEDGLPKAKLHGLRMLDPVVFSHIPLSSADSCNVARNIGLDSRWTGAFSPRTRYVRAVIMMERIEAHASAHKWSRHSAGVAHNLELFG